MPKSQSTSSAVAASDQPYNRRNSTKRKPGNATYTKPPTRESKVDAAIHHVYSCGRNTESTDLLVEKFEASRLQPFSKDPHIYVVSSVADAQLAMDIYEEHGKDIRAVGFDVEWTPHREAYPGAPSVIQIAFNHRVCVLFQVFRMCHRPKSGELDTQSFPSKLARFLTKPKVAKVGVAAISDMQVVQEHYGIQTANIVDLQSIAHARRLPTVGLAGLTYLFCDGVELPKGSLYRTNWDAANLQPISIKYAANDVFVALLILERMVRLPDDVPDLTRIPTKHKKPKPLPTA
ncbi:Exonuclease 3'-5' domain-containing protein 2 [Gaertneriomyces sp. JEL0708]|nr:Exonuclease 3'-5' domain-containing protein 2 [Gaertneriomyces sp. JEL0708]